jgi:hypothetical protein
MKKPKKMVPRKYVDFPDSNMQIEATNACVYTRLKREELIMNL